MRYASKRELEDRRIMAARLREARCPHCGVSSEVSDEDMKRHIANCPLSPAVDPERQRRWR